MAGCINDHRLLHMEFLNLGHEVHFSGVPGQIVSVPRRLFKSLETYKEHSMIKSRRFAARVKPLTLPRVTRSRARQEASVSGFRDSGIGHGFSRTVMQGSRIFSRPVGRSSMSIHTIMPSDVPHKDRFSATKALNLLSKVW